MTTKLTVRNTSQRIGSIERGSNVTVLGSGGNTETVNFGGGISTYSPPAGKKARIKIRVSAIAMGTNTLMGAVLTDNSRGIDTRIAVLAANGENASGEATLTDDDNVGFFGNNAANDGTLDAYMTVEELPG